MVFARERDADVVRSPNLSRDHPHSGRSTGVSIRLSTGAAPLFVSYAMALRLILIRDNDATYGSHFNSIAVGTRPKVLRTPIHAPRANASCERLLGSVRRACLDHILIVSTAHLRHIRSEYVRYFNRSRPHQGIKQRIPEPEVSLGAAGSTTGKVLTFPVLGGLHHDYRSVA